MATVQQGSWATVILDIDEVLCLGQAEAGWDLSRALNRGESLQPQRLATLFSPVARNALAVAHRRAGHVKYAISSTWREHFSREQLAAVLDGAGLYFVAQNLHEGAAWRCVPIHIHRDREAEIQAWLQEHHQGEPFVVLDDRHSAGKLLFVHHFPDSTSTRSTAASAPR